MNKSILAIIPARGGSKRLPGKNTINFCGKPLIAWTIDAALKSNSLSRVVVSTDSQDIAETAMLYGADVPFLRAGKLSQDSTSSLDVVLDVLEKLPEKYSHIALLQPTSPLRTTAHIDESVSCLGNYDGVIGVTEIDHPIEWTNTLGRNFEMCNFIKQEYEGKLSQDFPTRYRINGAIYILKVKSLIENKLLIPRNNALAYVMSRKSSVDIDTKEDLALAMLNHLGPDKILAKMTRQVIC